MFQFKYRFDLLWIFKKEKKIFNDEVVFFTRNKPVMIFLSTWFFFQAIIPFRHHFIHGDPSWTGEGHYFSWRMMLYASTDAVKFYVELPETGQRFPVALEKYINFRQFRKMGRTPRSYHRFAHFLADEIRKEGVEDPIIKMEIYKSVNERIPRLLNDTSINYAEKPYIEFRHSDWFQTWDKHDDPLEYREERFEHWSELIFNTNTSDQNY